MAQFDVFKNPSPTSARAVPWLLVVQSDLLDELPTRMVAPLIRPSALGGPAITRLNPSFRLGGRTVVMLTQQVGAVATRSLVQRVGSLAAERTRIVGAVDVLLSGV